MTSQHDAFLRNGHVAASLVNGAGMDLTRSRLNSILDGVDVVYESASWLAHVSLIRFQNFDKLPLTQRNGAVRYMCSATATMSTVKRSNLANLKLATEAPIDFYVTCSLSEVTASQ